MKTPPHPLPLPTTLGINLWFDHGQICQQQTRKKKWNRKIKREWEREINDYFHDGILFEMIFKAFSFSLISKKDFSPVCTHVPWNGVRPLGGQFDWQQWLEDAFMCNLTTTKIWKGVQVGGGVSLLIKPHGQKYPLFLSMKLLSREETTWKRTLKKENHGKNIQGFKLIIMRSDLITATGSDSSAARFSR